MAWLSSAVFLTAALQAPVPRAAAAPAAASPAVAGSAHAGLTSAPPISPADDSSDWLHAERLPSAPAAYAAGTPDLATGAALDIVCMYRQELGRPGAAEEMTARFVLGAEEVRRARLRADLNGDGALDAGLWANAALLLRLRTLEAMAWRLERDSEGLASGADAESLAARLQAEIDGLRAGPAALLPLAAGLHPGRAAALRLHAALRQEWRRRLETASPGADPSIDFHLWHVLAAEDAHAGDDLQAHAARNAWERTLRAVAAETRAGRLRLFRADDPGRRLSLAVGALCRDGALAAWTARSARRFLDPCIATSAEYAFIMSAIDSLQASLAAADSERRAPIHGSRRNYYRPAGEAAPTLAPGAEEQARQTARAALAALRTQCGARLLSVLGVRATADVEPLEIVPGQSVTTAWSLATARDLALSDWKAWIGALPVEVRQGPARVAAGDSALVRTAFAILPGSSFGAVLTPSMRLGFTLAGWGDVVIEEHTVVRVVAPVQATLTALDGALVRADRKGLEICVTSRSPVPVAGTLQVLSTNDCTIAPARSFTFQLRRPAESVRQRLEIGFPRPSSPGPYDIVVRLEVDGRALGTLRAQLVKPVEWVVAGPFATPARGLALPPEGGVNLQSRYRGAGGVEVAWQAVTEEAYDGDGGLDFAALFPGAPNGACACACTVFEAAEAQPATLWLEGAARVSWNGRPPGPGGEVRVENGRNTLLVRSCRGGRGWPLRVELRDTAGKPLRSVANDQARLAEGYSTLGRALPRAPQNEPADRLVHLSFRAPAAQLVAVLGAFNAWVPLALERQPDGSWQRDLRLSPGRYAYKLLVDGRLHPDPQASAFEPDGFGGRNSLLIVR